MRLAMVPSILHCEYHRKSRPAGCSVICRGPNQQFGPSTLFVPEAQLRHRWDVGRVSPYVGGGWGTALVKSDFHSEWDPTYSVASGAGVRLTERLGLTGEFRLRVHEWRGGATTSELSTGVTWQLPSF
jgi:opacity protein-like surface antigen